MCLQSHGGSRVVRRRRDVTPVTSPGHPRRADGQTLAQAAGSTTLLVTMALNRNHSQNGGVLVTSGERYVY